MNKKEKFINDIKTLLSERTFPQEWWLDCFSHDLWYVKDYLRGYFTAQKVEVDGEEVELDELSYEVGYTRGQRAERTKGKWKHHKTKSSKNWYECDSCGWVHFQRSNFCPFCGADMRGEE